MTTVDSREPGQQDISFRLHPEWYGLPKDVQILGLGEKDGLVVTRIPLYLLDRSNVPVNEQHVELLLNLMQEEKKNRELGGQIVPSLTAQVTDPRAPSKGTLYLCDGFHRAMAHEKTGGKDLYSIIYLNTDLEQMWDLRIGSATNHAKVSFPRIVDWVNQIWNLTTWSKEISVLQAFSLVSVPNLSGARLGVNKLEVEAIKDWVVRKSKLWQKEPRGIYQHLQIAQKADPELVKKARTILGRENKEGVFTKAQLRAIADVFPGDYESQQRIAEVAERQGLTERETRILATTVLRAHEEPNAEETTQNILTKDWRTEKDQPKPNISRVEKRVRPAAPAEYGTSMNTILDQLWDAEVKIADLQFLLAIRDGRITLELAEVEKEPVKIDEEALAKKLSGMDREIEQASGGIDDSNVNKDARLAAAGDEEAFGRLFEEHRESIYRFIYLRVEDSQTAEDITQRVFMKAWEKIPSYQERGVPFRAWLFRIARNDVIDHYRTRKEAAPLEAAINVGGSDSYEMREMTAYLNSAPIRKAILLNTTPDQRSVLILRHVLGLTTEQVSMVLEKQQGAVRALDMRAQQTIRKIIGASRHHEDY